MLNVNVFWLWQTFTGDVRLIFAEKELQIVVESSQYNLTILSARLPDLKIPEGGVCLSTGFLQEAMKHCSAAIAKDAVGARGGIEINIADDAVPSAGVRKIPVLQSM